MQKICSLLLMVLAAQTMFAGKSTVQKSSVHAVIEKYDLMTSLPTGKKEKKSAPKDVVFEALMHQCKRLRAENEKLRHVKAENEELKQLLAQSGELKFLVEHEKQEQPSSTNSSPTSAVAISPTNEGEEQRLLSPDEMLLATPESNRVKSPTQSPAHHSYYYEYPGYGKCAGMSPGIPDLKKSKAYDVYYLPVHSDCP